MTAMRLEPVRADGQTCARCGADKAEVKKYGIRCMYAWSRRHKYEQHIWKWSMDDDRDSD